MTNKILVFKIEDQRYGLYLTKVDRVIRAVEMTQLPKAPGIVTGVINVKGRICPVFDIRKRFRLSSKEIDINDCIVLSRTSKRNVALWVDEVENVIEIPEEKIIAAEKIIPGLDYVEGVAKMDDGMILIHNLDTFLSIEEENVLNESLIEV